MSVPQPVVAAPAARKIPLYVVGAVVLLGVLVAVYFWRGDRIPEPPKTAQTEPIAERAASVDAGEQGPTKNEEEALTAIEEAVNDPDAKVATFLDDLYKPTDTAAEESLPEYLTTAQEPTGPKPSGTDESPAAPPTELLTLKGIVKTRTWVKIYVDDQPPREFIFQPGSRPQWKAKRGFSVVIGNAAGIDFEFNGEEIKSLGNLGQVVRLNFPEDFVAPGLEG